MSLLIADTSLFQPGKFINFKLLFAVVLMDFHYPVLDKVDWENKKQQQKQQQLFFSQLSRLEVKPIEPDWLSS